MSRSTITWSKQQQKAPSCLIAVASAARYAARYPAHCVRYFGSAMTRKLVTLPALLALIPGFIIHRRWQIPVFGAIGLTCFVAAVLLVGPLYGEATEAVLAVSGGLILFAAHVANRQVCRRCSVGVLCRYRLDQQRNSVA